MTTDVVVRRVFVPNRGGHDYTDAYRFGDLVFCSEGFINRKDTTTMFNEMADAMYDSQEDDYILLTSLTSLCSIACSLFVAKHKRLNLLLFEEGQYIERFLLFP